MVARFDFCSVSLAQKPKSADGPRQKVFNRREKKNALILTSPWVFMRMLSDLISL
jgi:hypothetical protein